MNGPGTVVWIRDEVERSMARARECLGRFKGAGSSPGELRNCAAHLHQVTGALQIVGMDGATRFCEEIEQHLRGMEDHRPLPTEEALRLARRSMDALMRFVISSAHGRQITPMLLTSLLEEMQRLRGVDDMSPSELFFPDLDVDPPPSHQGRTVAEGALPVLVAAERARFQRGLLAWMRNDPTSLSMMRDALLAIDSAGLPPRDRRLWWTATAMVEALREGDLPASLAIKKLCGRIDQQMKHFAAGRTFVAERLLRDVLYHVAVARPDNPRVAEVQDRFALASLLPPEGEPAINALDAEERERLCDEARNALRGAKLAWVDYATGRSESPASFNDHVARLRGAADGLLNLPLMRLSDAIRRTGAHLPEGQGSRPEEILAEMANALLILESALEEPGEGDADLEAQVDLVSQRLLDAENGRGAGRALEPAAVVDHFDPETGPRTPLGGVAREIGSNLQHIEQVLDGFFRDSRLRPQLMALAPLMKQVRGAFRLLDLGEASDLMRLCERLVQKLAREDHAPATGDVELVADGLSSLDLFVKELEHDAPDRGRLVSEILSHFSPSEATLAPVQADQEPPSPSLEGEIRLAIERIGRLAAARGRRHEEPGVAPALRDELEALERDAEVVGNSRLAIATRTALGAMRRGATLEFEQALRALGDGVASTAPPRPSPEAARLVNAHADVVERELFQVYLREAREVLARIAAALHVCREANEPREALLTIRRCFHTLKGSGQMVRLNDLASAALEVEQVLSHWLQEDLARTPELLAFLADMRRAFSRWVDLLERDGAVDVELGGLAVRARALISKGAPRVEIPAHREVDPAAPAPDTVGAAERSTLPRDLFAVYLEEAAQHLEVLRTNVGRANADPRITGPEVLRAAHTLAGISRTAGFPSVGALATTLERWLGAAARAPVVRSEDASAAQEALEALERAYDDIRQGREPGDFTESVARLETALGALPEDLAPQDGDDPRDDIDDGLLPLFLEEAEDLMSVVEEELRHWRNTPDNERIPQAMRRTLHTLKGSARLVGAMRFGDVVHGMEERLADAMGRREFSPELLDQLEERLDRLATLVQTIGSPTEPAAPHETPSPLDRAPATLHPGTLVPTMRVSADTLDGLVDRAGEVTLARGHAEAEIDNVRQLMRELNDTIVRLRGQLREMELQAEIATPAQLVSGTSSQGDFDPLEFDRYTRLQELVRLMAESTADVVTVQSGLRRILDGATAALRTQARSGRELQDTLMSVRTVAFSTVVDRLYRVLRQACRELGKKARMEVSGQHVDLDRGVLEKLIPALEHLLRNAIAHGVESVDQRRELGKHETGDVRVEVRQEASEVVLEVGDDGAGLDYALVRRRALDEGLVPADQADDTTVLNRLIFSPGFTTATTITELAGRGVGLDAVRNEVQTLGGWVEVESTEGSGSRFRIHLPLTLVVSQTLLVKCAERTHAIPTHMVEHVQRVDAAAIETAYDEGHVDWNGQRYSFHYLGRLLGQPADPPSERRNPIIFVVAGQERLAIHVDTAVRNHEAVLRNLGPQISSIPGVIGATVLPDGEIVPISNPFFLARYRAATQRPARPVVQAPAVDEDTRPLVLVVDDSLTVRRLLEKVLGRNGYRVLTARDGVEAEQMLREFRPQVMLVDVEMPRMDGFELTRVVRGNRLTADIPIIIITSRTADKHREHALKLGADLFVGKPFVEEELLHHVAGFTSNRARARA